MQLDQTVYAAKVLNMFEVFLGPTQKTRKYPLLTLLHRNKESCQRSSRGGWTHIEVNLGPYYICQ